MGYIILLGIIWLQQLSKLIVKYFDRGLNIYDNGGPTFTHLPIIAGPAIDAGDNRLIDQDVITDQRGPGFFRINNGTIDIGAVSPKALIATYFFAAKIGWTPF